MFLFKKNAEMHLLLNQLLIFIKKEYVMPNFDAVIKAYKRIEPFIHKTPILKSQLLNDKLGCSVFFKCENFQKSGTFKYRGATNALLNLSESDFNNGVATHSSGNHAGALAKAAKIHGTKAYIVMPNNAPQVKIDAVKNYNGEITFCESSLASRESTLKKLCNKKGATFIHPYDNYYVVAGQGTACLELASQIDEPDFIIAPVGGGGLLSGSSISAKNIWDNTKVIGAEPKNADDAQKSFRTGKLQPPNVPNTIADGLLTALSDLTFRHIKQNVSDILTVQEQNIPVAMKMIFQYLKIVIEPSSAVALGVILENREFFAGKQVAVIISGGNYSMKL